MMVLPLIFIGVVAHFPAGLVLYWVTTNLWTVGQGLVTRRLVPRTPLGPGATARRPRPRSRRRTRAATARARTTPKPKPAPTAKPKPQPQQPRRVKRKKGGARR